MNEPLVNNPPETPPETPPGETPPGTPPVELTPQQMVDSLIEARGGIPKPELAEGEEISEREQALLDSNFQMETRFMMQDMQRVVDSKIPDASDQQSFAIAAAMTKGDLGEVIDAVTSAQQQMQEKGR